MIRKNLLRTLALAALVVMFGARDASAAFVALVPTASGPASHSYDLILDTEGAGLGAFDAFLSLVETGGCAGCLVLLTVTDNIGFAGGQVLGPAFISAHGSSPTAANWGGFNATGLDIPPVAGVVIGTLTVAHTTDTGSASPGTIDILVSGDPPSSFQSVLGPLPSTSCPDPALGCALASIPIPAPEPGALVLLGMGLAGLAFVRRRV